MLPGLDSYGSDSEEEIVAELRKNENSNPLPKKKHRRFEDMLKLDAGRHCIKDCKGNKAEAVRNPAFEQISTKRKSPLYRSPATAEKN